jgi:hypothetical protein
MGLTNCHRNVASFLRNVAEDVKIWSCFEYHNENLNSREVSEILDQLSIEMLRNYW